MRTYLVTGGAGFIGSNYIHYMFRKYGDQIRIINVDALTYAGNLENLKGVESLPNYTFVKADIYDKEAIANAFLRKTTSTGSYILRRRAMWTEASAIRRFLCRRTCWARQ